MPHERPPLPWLHVAAFVVAIALASGVGAAVGASMGGSREASTRAAGTSTAAEPAVAVAGDRNLELALATLTDEMRRLGERLERAGPARAPVAGKLDEVAPVDGASWVAALERASERLSAAARRVADAHEPGPRMTEVPMRRDLLAALAGRESNELTLEHAYWPVQRVLDTYGRPSEILNDGSLFYRFGESDARAVHFRFGPLGLVHNVSHW